MSCMWLEATILDSAVLEHPDQYIPTISHHISPNESMHFSEDNTENTGDKLLGQKSHSHSTAQPGLQYKPPEYSDSSPI